MRKYTKKQRKINHVCDCLTVFFIIISIILCFGIYNKRKNYYLNLNNEKANQKVLSKKNIKHALRATDDWGGSYSYPQTRKKLQQYSEMNNTKADNIRTNFLNDLNRTDKGNEISNNSQRLAKKIVQSSNNKPYSVKGYNTVFNVKVDGSNATNLADNGINKINSKQLMNALSNSASVGVGTHYSNHHAKITLVVSSNPKVGAVDV